MRNFSRKYVDDDKYLRSLIYYIHKNPVESGLANKISDWYYSSCTDIMSNRRSFINKELILDVFDDIDNFKFVHGI